MLICFLLLSIGCKKKYLKLSFFNLFRSKACCGNTTFNSSPDITFHLVLCFGLTHTQSKSISNCIVPFVSTETKYPLFFRDSTSFLFTCKRGSPPVKITNFLVKFLFKFQTFSILFTSFFKLYLPPFSPLKPTKSVSQN